MILGDNISFGNSFSTLLRAAVKNTDENGRATVFGYYVPDSEHFSVVAFDKEGHVTSIEENPKKPKSNNAVTEGSVGGGGGVDLDILYFNS